MKRRFCLIFILVSVLMTSFAVDSEKNYEVKFDTRQYAPFYLDFGFRKSGSEAIENGEVDFSSMTLGEDQASAVLQLEAYWNIISDKKIELSLEIGALVNGEGESRKELDWTLEWTEGSGRIVLDSSVDDKKTAVIHTHQGQQYDYDQDSVALRGYVNVEYGSDDFKNMALDTYRGTLTLKVTSYGG